MQTKHANLKYAPCDSSDLRKLTDAWNVQFSTDKTIVDINLANPHQQKRSNDQAPGLADPGFQNFVDQNSPPPSRQWNSSRQETSRVRSANAEEIHSHRLVEPSPVHPFVLDLQVATGHLTDFKPEEPLDIAIKLEGVFPSPFGQRPNPPKSSTAILVGDADLLHGAMSVKRGNHNLQFLLNIVDTLAGGDTFADIRNRANITKYCSKSKNGRRCATRLPVPARRLRK